MHCTITGNQIGGTNNTGFTLAEGRGGGVAVISSSFRIENCIVAGNLALVPQWPDLNGELFVRAGANLIGVRGGVAGPLNGTPSAPLAPGLESLAWNGGPTRTMRLAAGSLALNAGLASAYSPSTDQRGYPRIAGTAPDLGALEMEAAVMAEAVVRGLTITQEFPGVVLRWGTVAGSYTVEQSTTMLPQSWTAVPGLNPNFDSVNATAEALIPGSAASRAFYRVRWSAP
jgi:hypothetical protein